MEGEVIFAVVIVEEEEEIGASVNRRADEGLTFEIITNRQQRRRYVLTRIPLCFHSYHNKKIKFGSYLLLHFFLS